MLRAQYTIVSRTIRMCSGDRIDPLLLGRVLLQDIVLNGARELADRGILVILALHIASKIQALGLIVMETLDLFQIYALKERLHIVENVDRHTFAADLAPAHAVVGVVTHQGRHVEVHRLPWSASCWTKYFRRLLVSAPEPKPAIWRMVQGRARYMVGKGRV